MPFALFSVGEAMTDYFRFYGHSFVEVSLGNTPVLFDPYLENSEERITPNTLAISDFNDIALIFLTSELSHHLEPDNVDKLAYRNNSLVVGPEPATRLLGIPGQFIESHAVGDSFRLLNLNIDVVEAVNPASSYPVGYVVRSKDRAIYHAGSTKFHRGMERVNDVDIAFLPIGGRTTMDLIDAVRAAKMVRPQVVVPIIYNTHSKIKADAYQFAKMMEKSAPNIEVVIPKLGEKIEF